jgi:hypothetical protein
MTTKVSKQPTVEDVVRLATKVQARLAKEGIMLRWQMSWNPDDSVNVSGVPMKVRIKP